MKEAKAMAYVNMYGVLATLENLCQIDDQAKAAEALRALYKTGFFQDVRLDHQGGILVVTVSERPAINKLTLVGN